MGKQLGISTYSFAERSKEGIPYLFENGLPYKGDIRSDARRVYLSGFKFRTASQTEWTNIQVPHCFNAADGALRDYRGDVFYEREITIEGDGAVLCFLGSFLFTEVYIDGIRIGKNDEGYLPFYFDISGFAMGRHRLTVKINNCTDAATIPLSLFPGHKVGWHHYAGLHRAVYIEYRPQAYAFRLDCIPRRENGLWRAAISALFKGAANESLTNTIRIVGDELVYESQFALCFDSEGIAAFRDAIAIANPRLWDIDTPCLYTCQMSNGYETAEVSFGLREVTWRDGKIYINGRQVMLKGVCRHEVNGEKGLATDSETSKRELALIKAMNGNFARLAHYPHSAETLANADALGIYLWEEVPYYQAGQKITHASFGKQLGGSRLRPRALAELFGNLAATSQAKEPELLKTAARSLAKLVMRDINHPSVITWSVGNEIWSVSRANGLGLQYLIEHVKKYDASRAVNYAAMCMPLMTGLFEQSFKYADWLCLNEYYGWYFGKISDLRKLAEKISKKYSDKPFVITETGSDTKFGLHDNSKHCEEFQANFLRETHAIMRKIKNFAGFTVWVLKDFPCPEYGEDNIIPYYNCKGLFDKDMNEKLSYQVMKEIFGAE
ncbi:MAG: hypothetical protein FWE98_02605 [Oscillospiraceae bacterium]|nr:hypothetical protein [Oscillospiraceae bacterium]